MNHDYAKIDREYQFNWRKERLEIARALGYRYISESIVETYRKSKGSEETTRILGSMTTGNNLLHFLMLIGEPRKQRGGRRF
ncbi:MAG: hypothetical protein PVI43_01575 [Candidatus Bathyarchaeota archaeon]|jgi:hypothetical protein